MKTERRGRKPKLEKDRVKAVTFTLEQWKIEKNGGMDATRQKAKKAVQ